MLEDQPVVLLIEVSNTVKKRKKKDTYILETCVDRCAFSVAEDYLDLLQLKVGRI